MKAWEVAISLLKHPFAKCYIEVESEWAEDLNIEFVNTKAAGKRFVISDQLPESVLNEQYIKDILCQ